MENPRQSDPCRLGSANALLLFWRTAARTAPRSVAPCAPALSWSIPLGSTRSSGHESQQQSSGYAILRRRAAPDDYRATTASHRDGCDAALEADCRNSSASTPACRSNSGQVRPYAPITRRGAESGRFRPSQGRVANKRGSDRTTTGGSARIS